MDGSVHDRNTKSEACMPKLVHLNVIRGLPDVSSEKNFLNYQNPFFK